MRTKQKNQLLGYFVLLILGVVVLSQTGIIRLGYGDSKYPFPAKDRVFSPVSGFLKCEKMQGGTVHDSLLFDSQSLFAGLYGYKIAKETCNYKAGCFVGQVDVVCPPLATYSDSWVKIGGISGRTRSEEGEEIEVGGRCWYTLPIVGTTYLAPEQITVDFRGYKAAVYRYTEGYGNPEIVPGSSPNCDLRYADLTQLERYQNASTPIPHKEMALGDMYPILVGWREEPAFGNVNPQGTYQGKNVACSVGGGLYEVEKVYTEGGHDYWVESRFLTSNIDGKPICCSNGDCYGGQVCDGYVCKDKGTVCPAGSCPWGTDIECGPPETCSREGDSFVLHKNRCGADGCCQQETQSVACCQSECDAMSTATTSYVCDYKKGCVPLQFKKECGAGHCCNVPPLNTRTATSPYLTQSCGIGADCCPIPGEQYRGYCSGTGCTATTTTIPADSCEAGCVVNSPFFGVKYPDLLCLVGCWVSGLFAGVVRITSLMVEFVFALVLGYIAGEIAKRVMARRVSRNKQGFVPIFSKIIGLIVFFALWVYII